MNCLVRNNDLFVQYKQQVHEYAFEYFITHKYTFKAAPFNSFYRKQTMNIPITTTTAYTIQQQQKSGSNFIQLYCYNLLWAHVQRQHKIY